MGGKVLEFKNEKIYNEAQIDDLVGLVHDGLLSTDVAADRALQKYGISKEKFMKRLEAYDSWRSLKQSIGRMPDDFMQDRDQPTWDEVEKREDF